MAGQRASAITMAFAPDGKRQANFATPMALTALTARLRDDAKGVFTKEQTREDVLDCSAEELYARLLTGEIGSLQTQFDCALDTLSPLVAYAMGVAAAPTGSAPNYTHQLSELPFGIYGLPAFSVVFGFQGQPKRLLMRGCVVNSFTIQGQARGKITCNANIRFALTVDLTDPFAFPPCINEMPLRFDECELKTDGVKVPELRSFNFTYDNQVLTGDHAFTDEGIHATRLERADRRTRTLNYERSGDISDALYTEADAGVIKPYTLQLGKGAKRLTFNVPRAEHTLDGGGLKKDGQAGETRIGVVATPLVSDTGLVMSATAINSQSTAYLIAG